MESRILPIFCILLAAIFAGSIAQSGLAPAKLVATSNFPGVVHLSWTHPSLDCGQVNGTFVSWVFLSNGLPARCNAVTFADNYTRCFSNNANQTDTYTVSLNCGSVTGPSSPNATVFVPASKTGVPEDLQVVEFKAHSALLSWTLNGATCTEVGTQFSRWTFSAYSGDTVTYHVETDPNARSTLFSGLIPGKSYSVSLNLTCADPARSTQTATSTQVDQPYLVQSYAPGNVFVGGFDTEVFLHNNSSAVDVEVNGIQNCLLADSTFAGVKVEYSEVDEFGYPSDWYRMKCSLKKFDQPQDLDTSSYLLSQESLESTSYKAVAFNVEASTFFGTAYLNCTVNNYETLYQIRASVLCANPKKTSNATRSATFLSNKDFTSAATLSNLEGNAKVLSTSILVNVNQATFDGKEGVQGLTLHDSAAAKKKRSSGKNAKKSIAVMAPPSNAVEYGDLLFTLNAVTQAGPLTSDYTQNPIVLKIKYEDYGFVDSQASQMVLYFVNSTSKAYQSVSDTCPPQFQLSNVNTQTKIWTVYICHLTAFKGFLVPPPGESTVFLPSYTTGNTFPTGQFDTLSSGTFATNAIIGGVGTAYQQRYDKKTVAIAVVVAILGTTLLVLLVLLLIWVLLMKRRRQAAEQEEEPTLPRENVVLLYKSFIPIHNDDIEALSPKGIASVAALRLDLAEDESSNDGSSTHTDSQEEESETDNPSERDEFTDDKKTGEQTETRTDASESESEQNDATEDSEDDVAKPTLTAASPPAPSVSVSAPAVVSAGQAPEEGKESEDEESESESEEESSSGGSDGSQSSEDSDDSETLKP